MSWARLRGSRSAGRTGCSKGYAGHTGLIHHSPENLLGRAVQSRVPMCSEDRTLPMRGGPGSAFNGAERAEMLVSVLLSSRKRVSCADRARLLRDLSHLEIFNSVRIRYRRLEATKDRAGLTSLHRMCPGPRKVFPPCLSLRPFHGVPREGRRCAVMTRLVGEIAGLDCPWKDSGVDCRASP